MKASNYWLDARHATFWILSNCFKRNALSKGSLMLRQFMLVVALLHSSATVALAASAITSDGTMGTAIAQGGANFDITGGTRSGSNLFHSFGLFNVGTGDTANFLNNTGLNNSNIIGRVTGGQTSSVFGTIKTTNFGNTSLFLVNPAGWLFGPTASLNVGGSFHVSTADYLKFADGAKFHADLSRQSTLTTAPVSAFGFSSQNPAGTTIQGSSLQVPTGETISIASGAIDMVGTLFAPAGKIQLGSVASSGEVPFNIQDMNLTEFGEFGAINLNSASLNSSGNGGGMVIIRGDRLVFDRSNISTNNLGSFDSTGTAVDISGEGLTLTNGTFIQSESLGSGRGGSVRVMATDTINLDGPFPTGIFADAVAGGGDAGNINVNAKNITLNGAEIRSDTFGSGNGGNVTVAATELVHLEGAPSTGIFADTFGRGNGGTIAVVANNITLTNGAQISSSTSANGNGGAITLKATNTVSLSGGSNNLQTGSGIFAQARIGSTGNAGGIAVEANNVIATNGGRITSSTFGAGDGGSISISAKDSVVLSGAAPDGGISSGIITEAFSFVDSAGKAGDITVETGSLTLARGGEINSSTSGSGRAGNISIAARDSVSLLGQGDFGTIRSDTSGDGDGGKIVISTPDLRIEDGVITTSTIAAGDAGDIEIKVGKLSLGGITTISSETRGAGNGGTISINATDSIAMSGIDASIVGDTFSTGDGGKVVIFSPTLIVNDGNITTDSFESGHAGNIEIKVIILNVNNGGLISSSTFGTGEGGTVAINAQDSIALSGRDVFGNRSSLLTSSEGGGKAGEIVLHANNVDISDGALISAQADFGSTGNAGDVVIDGRTLTLTGGALISTTTFGSGQGGDIKISATDSVTLANFGSLSSEAHSSGDAGRISVSAPRLTLTDQGRISTQTRGDISAETAGIGNAGDIVISVKDLSLARNAHIDSSASGRFITEPPHRGRAGNITINAADSVSVSKSFIDSNSDGFGGDGGRISISAPKLGMDEGIVRTITVGPGQGGDISLRAGRLTLTGGSLIDSDSFGSGSAGTVMLAATEAIDISGISTGERVGPSTTTSSSFGSGAAGSVTIYSPVLRIDQGIVETSANGTGKGGDILVKTNSMQLTQGASVSTQSIGTGAAGNITIITGNSLRLANSSITAQADTADGGDINIRAGTLVDLLNSQITTAVGTGNGRGGNITIDPPVVVLNHSQISANAHGGPGGNVTIIADAFLKSADSSVTASSDLNTQGIVDIQSPINDLSGSLAPLPENIVQATSLLRQSCATRYSGGKLSSLASSGRGGMPFEPGGFMLSPLSRSESPTAQSSNDTKEKVYSYLRSPFPSRLSLNAGCS